MHTYIYISIYNTNYMSNLVYIVNRSVMRIFVYYVKIIRVSMFMICSAEEI